MGVEEIISNAGRRRLTVQIKVETRKGKFELMEVEPYGRKKKGTRQIMFCLDVNSYEYKNIDMTLIHSAQMTRSMFKPRYPIEF